MAIEHEIKYNTQYIESAIFCTARYYEKVKNYVDMEKYYLMAINDYGNVESMKSYGFFLMNVKKDCDNAEKYWLMTLEHGDKSISYTLGHYYDIIKENFKKAKKYYILDLEYLLNNELTCDKSISRLETCYERNNKYMSGLTKIYIKYQKLIDRQRIINSINKSWNCTFDNKPNRIIQNFLSFEFRSEDEIPTSLKLFVHLLKQKITIIKLHFEYTIGNIGYNNAKDEFISLVKGE